MTSSESYKDHLHLQQSQKIVMTFGTFDLLHPGHLHYLREAQKYGSRLIVVVARDHRVETLKGRIPIDHESRRVEQLRESFPEAIVMLGDETDIFTPIRAYRPDILAFGYDQRVDESLISTRFPDIQIVRIGGYETSIYKSSLLRKERGL